MMVVVVGAGEEVDDDDNDYDDGVGNDDVSLHLTFPSSLFSVSPHTSCLILPPHTNCTTCHTYRCYCFPVILSPSLSLSHTHSTLPASLPLLHIPLSHFLCNFSRRIGTREVGRGDGKGCEEVGKWVVLVEDECDSER